MTLKGSALYQAKAVGTAVLTYLVVAMASTVVVAPVMGDAPDNARIAFVAVTTTVAGMIVSRWATYRLLPATSGAVVTISLIVLTCGTYGYSWLRAGAPPNMVSTFQSLLLMALAALLFLASRPRR